MYVLQNYLIITYRDYISVKKIMRNKSTIYIFRKLKLNLVILRCSTKKKSTITLDVVVPFVLMEYCKY